MLSFFFGLFFLIVAFLGSIFMIVQSYKASLMRPEWKGRIWISGLLMAVSNGGFWGTLALSILLSDGLSQELGSILGTSFLILLCSSPFGSYYIVKTLYGF